MKNLVLLRHAKSSWKDSSLRDFDRPLNERGRKAAVLMGGFMRKRLLQPDLILCSPAQRARETATLVLESAGIKASLVYDERIYEASAARLVEVLAEIEENREEAMLIGHNPGMEDLFALLTGTSEHLPTAALARVILNSEDWRGIVGRQGQLEWLVKPKDLDRSDVH